MIWLRLQNQLRLQHKFLTPVVLSCILIRGRGGGDSGATARGTPAHSENNMFVIICIRCRDIKYKMFFFFY